MHLIWWVSPISDWRERRKKGWVLVRCGFSLRSVPRASLVRQELGQSRQGHQPGREMVRCDRRSWAAFGPTDEDGVYTCLLCSAGRIASLFDQHVCRYPPDTKPASRLFRVSFSSHRTLHKGTPVPRHRKAAWDLS